MAKNQRKSSLIVSAGFFNESVGFVAIRSGHAPIEAQTQALNAMGFKSKEEYIETYPGSFMDTSDITFEAVKSAGFPEGFARGGAAFNTLNGIFTRNTPWNKRMFIEPAIRGWFDDVAKDAIPMFIIQPTIDDILSSNLPQVSTQDLVKKLWFCSDWKEEGDSV